MKIGFLGIGRMGAPMARNLLAAGHQVTVWNRDPAKAMALGPEGAVVAATPAQAVAAAEIVISILSDGRATEEVLAGAPLRAALPEGGIWIEMASVKPEQARAQAADLAGFGLAHLDAPVSGGTVGAEAGTLAIMVGGGAAVFDRASPVLEAMGRPFRVGPSGAGMLAKLANQAIVAIAISAVAEATLLLQEGGADPAAVREALRGGFADSTILQQHGARMSEGNFIPGGASSVQLKDLNNIMAEAQDLGLILPATEAIQARFGHLVDQMQGGDLDHAALYLELRARNGMDAS